MGEFFGAGTTATDLAFWTMTGKAEEWNVPLFLGEFGAHADTLNGPAYVDLQYERLDDHFASGAQWNWTPAWTEEERDGWNREDLSITDDSGELLHCERDWGGQRAGRPRLIAPRRAEGELRATAESRSPSSRRGRLAPSR